MNNCVFSGRLVADAETRFTPNGKAVVTFRIAVDSGYGEYKRTDFLPCVIFGGDKLAQYLTKGKAVILSAEVRTRVYEKKNGEKASITEFIVKQPGGTEFQQGAPRPKPGTPADQQLPDNYPATPKPQYFGDDDLPF